MTQFEIRDNRFFDIIDKSAKLEVIAEGFIFTEGPIWHPGENWLVFSDIIGSKQFSWSHSEGLSVFRQPSNMTNGNCFDRDGRIVSCEHATSRLVRHDHGDRVVTTLADHFEGRALNSPNDVVVDSAGRIWFTDPTFGRIRDDVGIPRDCELDFQGVYRLDPDGSLVCVLDDFIQPNGLCLSLDETVLYVNDSADPCIRRFDISEDGSLSGDCRFVEITGEQEGRKWVPDGMKVSNCGHIFCNGPNGVHLLNGEGECLGVIRFPEKSTNFCFGGPERDKLFVTASSRLYCIQTKTNGPSMIPGF
ncbi:MAG: SMP-30/gluconolactonase/LRE family protein [Rhizobiaceae bacterium]